MGHLYRIRVDHVQDAHGVAQDGRFVEFTAENHDDIIAIIDRVRGKAVVPEDEAAAFSVGLKLLGEVMLRHRKEPLFTDFGDAFMHFMKRLKQH